MEGVVHIWMYGLACLYMAIGIMYVTIPDFSHGMWCGLQIDLTESGRVWMIATGSNLCGLSLIALYAAWNSRHVPGLIRIILLTHVAYAIMCSMFLSIANYKLILWILFHFANALLGFLYKPSIKRNE